MSVLRLFVEYVPRSLRRGGRRAAVTVGCIAVGVMAVVALQVAALSVGDALTANVRGANGGDIAVSSNSAPLSASDLQQFAALQRSGSLSTWTPVSRVHVTATTAAGHLVPFDANVVDTTRYPVGGQPTFVDPAGADVGSLMRGPGDVLVSAVLADELGAHVGTALPVRGVGGSGLHATVRGILAQVSLEHAAVMYVGRVDQAALSDAPPQYVAVYANVTGDPAPVAATLRQAFPQAGVTTVAEAVASAQQQVSDFHTYALLAGLVALLVAGVGIQNAMQSMLASRVAEVAVLKALGNPPLLVGGLFAAEAVVYGVAGGVLGTAVGIAGSTAVTGAVARATGISASAHIDAGVMLFGLLLGVGATLLFSILPIVGGVAVRPIGLLRGDLPPARSAPRFGLVFAAVVALFVGLAAYVTGDAHAATLIVLGGLGGCGVLALLFAGAVALTARLRRPARVAATVVVSTALVVAAALAAPTLPAVLPLIGVALVVWAAVALGPARVRAWLLMAARSLDRRRARTAVTLVALFAGALSGGLTLTMASGLRDQIAQAIAANGSTNLVAVASQPTRQALLSNAARLPGVQTSQATEIAPGRVTAIDGAPLPASPLPSATAEGRRDPGEGRYRQLNGVTGFALASGDTPASTTIVRGRGLQPSDAGTLNVLVDQSVGFVGPGSTLTLADATTGNQVTVDVVGTYRRAGLRTQLTSRYTPRIYGDVAAARRLAGGDVQTVLSMTITPDSLVNDGVALQRAVPSALVANVNDLAVVVRTVLDDLLLILTVVTAMVVLAGVAVVANGVTLAMIERSREVALLKTVGFGPRHVLALVVVEFGFAGFLASAGAVMCIALALAILSRGVLQTPIAFSMGISGVLVAACTVITALTAWVAARGAALIRPLAALRNS